MASQLVVCLLVAITVAAEPAQLLSIAMESGATSGTQSGPSMKEIDEWLRRDLRAAGSHDVSSKTALGSSGDKYEIERIAVSDCRLTIRQVARHYFVTSGMRSEAPNSQIDGAVITMKDLDIGGLFVQEAPSYGNANIPSYLVRLSAVAERGDPFSVETEGYQGGPKKGPGRVFRLRVGLRGAAEKAVEMIRQAALLCGAPDVPLRPRPPRAATSAGTTTTAPSSAAIPPPAATAAAKLTNDQVIQMVSAGLSEQVIIMSIRQATARAFDLSTAGLIGLKKAGVSDAVIAAMQAGAQ